MMMQQFYIAASCLSYLRLEFSLCVRVKLKVCALFVSQYKRIKARSQPRVETGPFLIIPSVCYDWLMRY